MRRSELGNTGIAVTELCFGVLARTVIDGALTLGYINKDPASHVDSYLEYQAIRTSKYLRMVDVQRKQMPIMTGLPTAEQRWTLEVACKKIMTKWPQERNW